ncbi:MAG: hypothetical protein AAGF56_09165 [Pseudomonadota bacterium]
MIGKTLTRQFGPHISIANDYGSRHSLNLFMRFRLRNAEVAPYPVVSVRTTRNTQIGEFACLFCHDVRPAVFKRWLSIGGLVAR